MSRLATDNRQPASDEREARVMSIKMGAQLVDYLIRGHEGEVLSSHQIVALTELKIIVAWAIRGASL